MKIPVEYIIGLLSMPKIGRKTAIKLISNLEFSISDWRDLMDYVKDQSASHKLPTYSETDQAHAKAYGEQVVEDSEKYGIKILSFLDERYPKPLLDTGDYPVTLSYKGNIDSLHKPNVAVIGTRDPSDFGLRIGERLGEVFAQNKFNVVSGLAKGCDAAGHKGAIKGGGTTTAVMAHGLDTVYPKENRELAEEILANDGVLVSEYFVKEKARSNYFVERDRIQAGLSQSVVVVETDVKGGTMHTVKYTQDYNRKLACVDHPDKYKDHPKAQGNRKLIREGNAYALNSKDEIDLFTYLTFDDYFEHLKPASNTLDIKSKEEISYKWSNLSNLVKTSLRLHYKPAFFLDFEPEFNKLTNQISERITALIDETNLEQIYHKISNEYLKPSNEVFKTIIIDEAFRSQASKLERDFATELSNNYESLILLWGPKNLPAQGSIEKGTTINAKEPKNKKNNNKNDNQMEIWQE